MKKAITLLMSILSLTLTACSGSKDATTIKLNKNTLNLVIGETEALSVTLSPNISDPNLVWEIDIMIASLHAGVVTALVEGIANIKVFLDTNKNLVHDENEPSDVCLLTITRPPLGHVPVTSLSLNKTAMSLSINSEELLTATILPNNATIKTVTWFSSNSSVATINNGKVTAISEGSATITAYVDENLNGELDNNEKNATCLVTVTLEITNPYISVFSVTLSNGSVRLEEGSEAIIYATVLPTNATYQEVTWFSADNLIATVTNGNLRGVKTGTTFITAYVDENNNGSLDTNEKWDSVSVNVTAKEDELEPNEDPIPARGENLPIGNTSLSGPANITPADITNWVNFDFYSTLPPYWSFIMGNNKKDTSSDFYAESSGGGFKFSHLYYGLQSPLLNSWLKTEVRLTVSQVNGNSQSANQHKDKPIFHIYSYDRDGYYLGMQTYEQQSKFANMQEIKFYITNSNMAYFEIRLNAFPTKGSQCYNFGVSAISIKGWPYA